MGFSLSVIGFLALDGPQSRALHPGQALAAVEGFASFFAHFFFRDETAHRGTSFLKYMWLNFPSPSETLKIKALQPRYNCILSAENLNPFSDVVPDCLLLLFLFLEGMLAENALLFSSRIAVYICVCVNRPLLPFRIRRVDPHLLSTLFL